MAVAVIARYPDLTPETYGQVIASLELDVNPPAGAIFHMAGDSVGGVVASEIWQTEQTFRAFLDYRLRPALRMHGVHRDPIVEISALHNVYAPEMFTIERMGAVSLPAHMSGAALTAPPTPACRASRVTATEGRRAASFHHPSAAL